MTAAPAAPRRCDWVGSDPLYCAYHDLEWGQPLHDDRRLFELLCLEGAQAGLSWITILRKREAYRQAFDQFDAQKISVYGSEKIGELLANSRIIRNRLKIEAVIGNARAFLTLQQQAGGFDRYLWSFVAGQPIRNQWQTMREVPASTPLSETLSHDLKQRGFKFVGPTICYAYMQSAGLVNDHLIGCFRHAQIS